MRRFVLLACVFAFVLVGCGGTSDTTVADPPQSTAIEKTDNAQIDKLIGELKQTVPERMLEQKVKPETLEQKVYRSTASLEEVADFYKQLEQKGWYRVHRLPGAQDGVLYDSYSNGNTALIITAFDAKQLGDEGLIIYTAKGTHT